MMPRIRLLNRLLANQIAAGEVIERPASVVKELLENSIDAGATQIDVEIQQGGMRLIKVRDNGYGIYKDDLQLAISRHATSKISRIEDLTTIQSLGFRGEALASIAAVSRFRLSSKAQEQDQAWQLHGNGVDGDIELLPTAHPQGTTITVQDSFFNTPARRKFMRSEKTEYLQIEEVFKRIALSHLTLGFSLTYEQRLIFRLPPALNAQQQMRRIAKIFGKDFIEQAAFIDAEATGLSLSGWLGSPQLTRSQNDLQYVYLNGRLVRDKVINHALRQAYTDLLPEGRNALYVLYLIVDPELVDVNVHPTKHEVRFQQSRLIHDFILHTLRKTLKPQPVEQNITYDVLNAIETPVYQVTEAAPVEYARAAPLTQNSWGKPLTLLQKRWLLSEIAEGVLFIDTQAAKRALLVEALLLAYTQAQLTSLALLFPYSHVTTEENVQTLLAQREVLQAVGITLDQLAPNTVILRSMPHLLENVDGKKFLLLLLDQIKRNNGELAINDIFALAAFAERLLALSQQTQQQNLLTELHQYFPLQLPNIPTFCRHLSYTELMQDI